MGRLNECDEHIRPNELGRCPDNSNYSVRMLYCNKGQGQVMGVMSQPTGISIEINRRRRMARKRKPMAHVDNGWPHYHSASGRCLCLDSCCHDPNYGDICKTGVPRNDQPVPEQKTEPKTVEKGSAKRHNPQRSQRGVAK